MTLGNEEYRDLAKVILATCPVEIDCDQWLDLVGQYLELNAAGQPIPESLRPVEDHLRLCPDCTEEYAVMLDVMRNLGGPENHGAPSHPQ